MKGKWITVEPFGGLVVEKFLVCLQEIPLLFVAKNLSTNQRYLVLCMEDDEEYFIAECSIEWLLEICQGSGDVASTFIDNQLWVLKYDNQIKKPYLTKMKYAPPMNNIFLEDEYVRELTEYVIKLQGESNGN